MEKEEEISNPMAFARSGYDFNDGAFSLPSEGMTLLDYFAGQVLNGVLANSTLDKVTNRNIAKHSYLMAQEILKERMKYDV